MQIPTLLLLSLFLLAVLILTATATTTNPTPTTIHLKDIFPGLAEIVPTIDARVSDVLRKFPKAYWNDTESAGTTYFAGKGCCGGFLDWGVGLPLLLPNIFPVNAMIKWTYDESKPDVDHHIENRLNISLLCGQAALRICPMTVEIKL
ncbi:hypothetical protein L873DRAFT_1794831 [Choiromyces venosus 120613-1]|uniref:Uncharacterized protein n=1 Tax=Choiromyces venosus 120613-1 TaxID=1336337 RepID=A0A3N4IZB3_9PEZI|nr:hypothetical protein L873DRAFT_1794831 [Choiromyces venosus 120613-1]